MLSKTLSAEAPAGNGLSRNGAAAKCSKGEQNAPAFRLAQKLGKKLSLRRCAY